jgi:hypothetical protein
LRYESKTKNKIFFQEEKIIKISGKGVTRPA